MPHWLENLLPIVILLVAVVLLTARLPKVDVGHSAAFIARRRFNWLPLGLTYAFLYMGRYNLTVAKNALGTLMTKEDFAQIFFWGTLTYGIAFVINGPLTDRIGGRKTIMLSAVGSALCNLAMGWVLFVGKTDGLVLTYSLLYSANMYFQSFGAVSIVKVNAAWFHVRERGVFGGIFGILISLGIYFAYDWGKLIVDAFSSSAPASGATTDAVVAAVSTSGTSAVFFIPAAILVVFAVIDYFMVFDQPSHTGHADFDTGEARIEGGDDKGVLDVAILMFKNPVIMTIAAIEFCSGYLRQAIMQWYTIFAKQVGISEHFVSKNWGMLLCIAGITGGMFAGTISDHLFGSRRGPVAVVLYAGMLVGSVAMWFLLESPLLGWLVVLMSLCIIGVHGMLSGTASMDFAGKRNTGLAVGLIDGFVYLGTALQAIVLGNVLPKDGTPGANDPANWGNWPLVMIPPALIGLVLGLRLWNAKPRSGGGAH